MTIATELPKTKAEFQKAADIAVTEIEKAFGKGAIAKLSKRSYDPIPVIPTGIFDVDQYVCGVGGLPKGRVVEMYGPESGGKTTMLLRVIAEAQKAGGFCAFIDAEHAFDPKWARTNGVNTDDLYVTQPDNGEQALEVTEMLVESGAFAVVGIDSVAALVPRAELEGEMGDSHMGLQARLMSQALRKLTGKVSKTGTMLVFINQVRDKIGVMFGSPETTTGGRALKFYASVRLDIRRIGQVKDGDTIIGSRVKIKGAKNKVAAPFVEAEIDLLYDRGFDHIGNVLERAVEFGVAEKSGSWYSYKGERLGQGKNAVVNALSGSLSELYTRIYKEVVEASVKNKGMV
jgi:recombination protein RecA